MRARQGGEISLWLVGALMAVFAAISMAALFSMRHERNIFAEAIGWLVKSPAGATAAPPAPEGGALRKCVIGGETVISNVDCARDPASKIIAPRDTRGIEAPRAPPPPESAQEPSMRDKMIEKAMR